MKKYLEFKACSALLSVVVIFASLGLHAQAPNWKAKWISIGYTEDPSRPVQVFEKQWTPSAKIKSATLYITSCGLYEGHINGKRIGEDLLTPGWTSYNKRLQYQKYEVSKLLKAAENNIQIQLASGWYRGRIGLGPDSGQPNRYGDRLALLFQLEILYGNGKTETLISDDSWKTGESAIRASEIYDGEVFDAGFKASTSAAAKLADFPFDNLVPTISEGIRKQERILAKKIFIAANGDTLADFGQNLAGFVQAKIKGQPRQSISIEHAEVLDKAGNFYTESLRTAKAKDVYILKGEGEETLEPHFSWHGFRYVRLKGFKSFPTPAQLTAVAIYSDLKPTGSFVCSSALLNQLQSNILWSQKSNFLDIPSDCPQRDERMGWMGDAMVFCRTAAFNQNVKLFFEKWLADVAADQLPNGAPTAIVPNLLGGFGGSSGWADVATVIPWTMHEVYGDKQILIKQYASMKAWVDYMDKSSKDNLFQKGFQFGDWLSYKNTDLVDSSAHTDVHLVSQCFYGYSTSIMAKTAKLLDKPSDAAYYEALLEKIKTAFNLEYVTPNGRLTSNTQTAYTLALAFDLLPEQIRPKVAGCLVDNIKKYNNHLTTGFLGTPYICHVLSRFGYAKVAYDLLLQESYPSWLYPVKMGATTIWERWDGIKPDGSFQNTEMNSFNHYAYGAIGDWMYQNILGIQAGSPGYKEIIIKPVPGGGLSWAKGSYESPNGKIEVDWKISGSKFLIDVSIPKGSSAKVWLPGSAVPQLLSAGKQHLESAYQP
ncbi:glycoside hydrolase family 78 protein [Pedobacter aquatilis]|uniref:glycoside hydrolase family 78 protein n=1 Tax=Pedobacter aquatilis TaxID=351343 RepID=UPI00292D96F1|nr:glycoside hydrolase family 78 protein [Pedobacter aquatilis]